MPVKQINTALGHSLPPEAPHNITFHIPGWDTAKALRRGDPDLLSRLDSIYPRFGPWREVRQLSTALHPLLSLPATHSLILFTHPSVVRAAKRYSSSSWRKPEHRIAPRDLLFRAVDIPLTLPLPSERDPARAGGGDTFAHGRPVRLYAVAYPADRAPGAVGVWQNYGVGISSRLAAALLPGVERGDARVLDWRADGAGEEGEDDVPPTEFLPLGEAHAQLRRRIAGLVGGRGGGVREEDVWLYPTGMAAIYRLHQALVEVRGPGTVVVLGSVFHNSYHMFQESAGGMKHFGRCDAGSGVMDALEAWLEGEKAAGRRVGFVFAEFPSNPILVSVDLLRLRELADKYDVPVVLDETIGSFCNIDVSGVADVVVTSITKSLSGYANVMGGSVALPPTSRHHGAISSVLAAQFRNEYFHADARKLLANAADYHARSAVLNRNALALATYLHREHAQRAASPVTAVLYPPLTDTASNYAAVMRPPAKLAARTPQPLATSASHQEADSHAPSPTPNQDAAPPVTEQQQQQEEEEIFNPGHGCLLAVDFTTLRTARAFYDHLSVYHGPHLGAHHTLAFPFNDAIWGTDPAAAAYLRTFGARAEQVRVSVGLEEEQELLDTFAAALEVAEGVWREEQEEKEKENGKGERDGGGGGGA